MRPLLPSKKEARSPPPLQSHTQGAERPGSYLLPSLRIPLCDYLCIVTHRWPLNCRQNYVCAKEGPVTKEVSDAVKSLRPNQEQRRSKEQGGGGCFIRIVQKGRSSKPYLLHINQRATFPPRAKRFCIITRVSQTSS